MKYKYVMSSGLAFDEENDIKRMEKYAEKGWILESIVGGIFYKFRKDKPQKIIYSLDYQNNVSYEYFNIFKEAGWNHVLSINNQIHIFSAKKGTNPIYSNYESEKEKYINMKVKTKRWILNSSILAIILGILMIISSIFIKKIFLFVLVALILDICILIINLMMNSTYNIRTNATNNKYKSKNLDNKLDKINVLFGCMFLFLGIFNLIDKKMFAIFFIILGIVDIYFGMKKMKKM